MKKVILSLSFLLYGSFCFSQIEFAGTYIYNEGFKYILKKDSTYTYNAYTNYKESGKWKAVKNKIIFTPDSICMPPDEYQIKQLLFKIDKTSGVIMLYYKSRKKEYYIKQD